MEVEHRLTNFECADVTGNCDVKTLVGNRSTDAPSEHNVDNSCSEVNSARRITMVSRYHVMMEGVQQQTAVKQDIEATV